MMFQAVRAKFHGISVTGADLDYHGSITLDPDQCTEAGIRPLEYVDIFNKSNGARWYTYVMFGDPGSRCCVLNGPSARQCAKGDQLIICASAFVQEHELYQMQPRILTFSPGNQISEVLSYNVFESEARSFDFSLKIEKTLDHGRRIGEIDIAAFRDDLRERGLSDHSVADVISRHLKAFS